MGLEETLMEAKDDEFSLDVSLSELYELRTRACFLETESLLWMSSEYSLRAEGSGEEDAKQFILDLDNGYFEAYFSTDGGKLFLGIHEGNHRIPFLYRRIKAGAYDDLNIRVNFRREERQSTSERFLDLTAGKRSAVNGRAVIFLDETYTGTLVKYGFDISELDSQDFSRALTVATRLFSSSYSKTKGTSVSILPLDCLNTCDWIKEATFRETIAEALNTAFTQEDPLDYLAGLRLFDDKRLQALYETIVAGNNLDLINRAIEAFDDYSKPFIDLSDIIDHACDVDEMVDEFVSAAKRAITIEVLSIASYHILKADLNYAGVKVWAKLMSEISKTAIDEGYDAMDLIELLGRYDLGSKPTSANRLYGTMKNIPEPHRTTALGEVFRLTAGLRSNLITRESLCDHVIQSYATAADRSDYIERMIHLESIGSAFLFTALHSYISDDAYLESMSRSFTANRKKAGFKKPEEPELMSRFVDYLGGRADEMSPYVLGISRENYLERLMDTFFSGLSAEQAASEDQEEDQAPEENDRVSRRGYFLAGSLVYDPYFGPGDLEPVRARLDPENKVRTLSVFPNGSGRLPEYFNTMRELIPAYYSLRLASNEVIMLPHECLMLVLPDDDNLIFGSYSRRGVVPLFRTSHPILVNSNWINPLIDDERQTGYGFFNMGKKIAQVYAYDPSNGYCNTFETTGPQLYFLGGWAACCPDILRDEISKGMLS